MACELVRIGQKLCELKMNVLISYLIICVVSVLLKQKTTVITVATENSPLCKEYEEHRRARNALYGETFVKCKDIKLVDVPKYLRKVYKIDLFNGLKQRSQDF